MQPGPAVAVAGSSSETCSLLDDNQGYPAMPSRVGLVLKVVQLAHVKQFAGFANVKAKLRKNVREMHPRRKAAYCSPRITVHAKG